MWSNNVSYLCLRKEQDGFNYLALCGLTMPLYLSYRGEERCVAGYASISGEEASEEKVSVHKYCHTTKFGWVFPRTKVMRNGVIDTVWLQEFARDIKALQSEIRKQTTLVYGDEKPDHQENSLLTDSGNECYAATMNCKGRVSTPEKTTSSSVSKVSAYSSVYTRGLESRGLNCRKLANSEGNLGNCYSDQGPAMENVHASTYNGESSGSEKSLVLDSRFNMYILGAKCDEYTSMQSDISRDSGIFSTDDASVVSENPGDKSLLQEIGDVLGDHNLSLEPCIHCSSLPIEDVIPASKENASCPVWLTRFSSTNDLSVGSWESQKWEVEHSLQNYPINYISPVMRRKTCVSEDSDSHVTPPAIVSNKEGCEEKQYMLCEKQNEESLLRHPPLQQISELAKLTNSFEGLSTRVEDLRSGLECLAGEVNESKRDFINMEERTAQLLASTVTSRHRLTRVRALQLLEDRLQEEWWTAYDPSSVSFHENYIV